MITNTTDKFIELLSEEGKVFRNGDSFTNRVTAPIGTDLSAWVEVDKSVEVEHLAALNIDN